ncbi:MAG: hypothetical protein A2504_13590 [Bdellovibrionales bacterium RIFOXYD12_FULL_39_22]|nr:MAG: hypothetical protein A2385_00315 [Bdellovibrionales bacterium RIFOXYB1_FULL_39_21]OFZ43879.1 MAG: hypothetical protein A2485_05215 [Bdellovibrionales bacterium RIFOXYC12_FULL_39_17]OFZ48787.1 MAG: hypothetical protein A2404_17630 [Bdellovibrionales bacterium RIFOXYC1_FULL_39_130]OFZ76507.1 MAG: hypothetical protein A2451_05005 [Bdellovibrionales bacterium RIFOXYC2_FULL_39_8]OFZ76520.1 MAG: hypothetical protein A2560_06295 [Bdellovibrionales bacterium RIFOXYD1_FULL_39_84]OFZ94754.1 MAG:
MSQQKSLTEWSGFRGTFNSWFFSTAARRLIEKTVFGNYWPTFYTQLEKNIKTGNETILDVAAGSGNFSIPIARRLQNGKVICIDRSKEMCHYLAKRATKEALLSRIEIINHDILEDGPQDNSIDWAISGNFMHECSRPEKIFSKMYQTLRPGGTILVVDFRDWHGYDGGDSHGPFHPDEFGQLFTNANFKNINIQTKRHFVIGTANK